MTAISVTRPAPAGSGLVSTVASSGTGRSVMPGAPDTPWTSSRAASTQSSHIGRAPVPLAPPASLQSAQTYSLRRPSPV
ncbi:hypothetical protein [Streptomyces sp. NPDC005805]|uniref:hypothetical protein n=1 Tax=Streptomyces sp. NPDC005805 TaxID=3157068 RepID=UPI0033C087F4